jgi:hypothetical protein
MVAAVIPFAAFAMVQTLRWMGSFQWVRTGLALAALAGMTFWTSRPLPPEQSLILAGDIFPVYSLHYQDRVQSAMLAGQWNEAADLQEEFLMYVPEEIEPMLAGQPARGKDKRGLALLYAKAHEDCGKAYQQLGKNQRAFSHFQRAQALVRAVEEGNKGP